MALYGLQVQCSVVVVLIKAMFTLCGIALAPVEFINISHTTYRVSVHTYEQLASVPLFTRYSVNKYSDRSGSEKV